MAKKDLKSKVLKITREFVLINVGVIILGILLVLFPDKSKDIICRSIGIALSVWGVFKIFEYFYVKSKEMFGSFALVQGSALIGFGVYIIIFPDFLAAMITFVLAIILFIGAVLKLQYALELARFGSKIRWAQAGAACIMIAASVIAFFNPFGKAQNIFLIYLGICLIVNGIWDLITMIYISRFVKNGGKKVKTKKIDSKNDQYIEVEFEENSGDEE